MQSYTPSIAPFNSDSTATFDNISFKYYAFGGRFLILSGRFRITDPGSVSTDIKIFLPSGYKTLDTGVGGISSIETFNTNSTMKLELRGPAGETFVRLYQAGGNPCLPTLPANTFVIVFGFIPLVM